MYKIFKDKDKIFKCVVDIQGADVNESKARFIIESSNGTSLVYNGTINENGSCEIPLPKNHIFDEGESGNITLEVIAENTLFTPWEDEFEVFVSKKVKITEMADDDTPSKNSINEFNKTRVSVQIEDDEEEIEEVNEKTTSKVNEKKVEEKEKSEIKEVKPDIKSDDIKKEVKDKPQTKKETKKEDKIVENKKSKIDFLDFNDFINKN